jgi:hypothetical protein
MSGNGGSAFAGKRRRFPLVVCSDSVVNRSPLFLLSSNVGYALFSIPQSLNICNLSSEFLFLFSLTE